VTILLVSELSLLCIKNNPFIYEVFLAVQGDFLDMTRGQLIQLNSSNDSIGAINLVTPSPLISIFVSIRF